MIYLVTGYQHDILWGKLAVFLTYLSFWSGLSERTQDDDTNQCHASKNESEVQIVDLDKAT